MELGFGQSNVKNTRDYFPDHSLFLLTAELDLN
ncbi:hypothetical protein Cycma_3152 [Cyclobacterium marinum DSM 745]|uniref:Uncharacterized protein n=1 Tax=Cyclobacterium marinum (strain ATCC 25205 / DSM 745 / LMG 13164 / NCIMB 1802) TaxID=880070 RepID=G0J6Y9_CYCMS|nr:hypothetical protein Cycma_3152 [Cyclobacterium marinum DSM 745]